jgi:hypothetical protein
MPEGQVRNTERVLISLLPAELVELDSIATRLARPGHKGNRSGAVRDMTRVLLNAEALGLVEISEDGIRVVADRRK